MVTQMIGHIMACDDLRVLPDKCVFFCQSHLYYESLNVQV